MWPVGSVNKSILLMRLIPESVESVDACRYVVGFTNKMP